MTPPNEVTQLLLKWRQGDRQALEQLLPLLYGELRQLAGGFLRRERSDHTLQATALVNEAYLRLVDQTLPDFQNRAHFFGVAAKAMRRILVEHARARGAAKRGGGADKVPVEDVPLQTPARDPEILDLEDALLRLEEADPRKARVIELRFYGGMTIEEIAQAEGLSTATVGRELRFAEAWLRREIK